MPAAGKSSTGLDPHLVAAFAYLLGLVSGILLLLIEKESRFVRFHAMQSTLTFGIVAIAAMLITNLPIFGWLLGILLFLAVVGLWIRLMYKAVRGEEYKLPYIGEIAAQQLG